MRAERLSRNFQVRRLSPIPNRLEIGSGDYQSGDDGGRGAARGLGSWGAENREKLRNFQDSQKRVAALIQIPSPGNRCHQITLFFQFNAREQRNVTSEAQGFRQLAFVGIFGGLRSLGLRSPPRSLHWLSAEDSFQKFPARRTAEVHFRNISSELLRVSAGALLRE